MLLAAEGFTNVRIASALEVTDQTAGKWRNRLAAYRMEGLEHEPRSGSGHPRRIDDAAVAEVISKTLKDASPALTHWKAHAPWRGLRAPSTIHRMRQALSLQPHRSETFKLSSDPLFVENEVEVQTLARFIHRGVGV